MINYEIERDESIERIEKLLRAFIDVSGYEIEEVNGFDNAKYLDDSDLVLKGGGTRSAMPQQKDYATIDYKVTNKQEKACDTWYQKMIDNDLRGSILDDE